MLLITVYLTLIVINLYKRKSKIYFFILLGYLWILFGWSNGNADWNIYINRYNNFNEMSSITEWLFTELIKLGHKLQMDYRMFLITISGICLILIAKTILELSPEPGLVLALYAIFCFPMDVTQVRFFVAFSIICFGIKYLFEYKRKKMVSSLIKWLISLFLAINIHMSVCVLLVLLIPIYFNRKIIFIFTICFNMLFILVSSLKTRIFSFISLIMGNDKANIVMMAASKYDFEKIKFVWFKTIFIFLGFLLIYLYIKYCFKSKKNILAITNDDKLLNLEFVFDCNIISLILIGLITVTTDFYRIQQIIVMMNYLVYSQYLSNRVRGKLKVKNIIIIGIALIFAFGALYNLVLRSSNYQTVFIPLFNNNVLFK